MQQAIANPFDEDVQAPAHQQTSERGKHGPQENPFDEPQQSVAAPKQPQQDVVNGTLQGVWQGLGDTVHGVGSLVRGAVGAAGAISPSRVGEAVGAIPKGSTDDLTKKIQEALVPQAGSDALASLSEAH